MEKEKEIVELILSIPVEKWLTGIISVDKLRSNGRAVVGFELSIGGIKAFIANGMGKERNSVLSIGSFDIVSEKIAELSLKLALIVEEQDRLEKSDRENEIYDKLKKYVSDINK